ncbi:hypothetical protein GYMLUDRAFT_246369 [Collybiopsis luxurians FD-317 M1]|uniref:Non-specific serine/threonine protein kinase n=1 Tax=Collybiopsis luxurians FD-317 M1 TaxID=944289 RepID=A0A0D0BRX4_9AGAR|nr:hypothetical protein GYMLUDRAFT_246369 [Collybiopsis luxurians FD-317 M1]
MHVCIAFMCGITLWNVAFTFFVGAAPLSVQASIRDQAPVYVGAQQVPLSEPSPDPSYEPSASLGSNTSRPLTFKLPAWVTAPYPKSLREEDRDAFNTTLQGITLARKHSSMGNNNAGVYAVASFDSSFAKAFPSSIAAQGIDPSRLLVKVLKDIDDDMIAEVKALKIVGQFVASGMLRVPATKSNEAKKKRRAGNTIQSSDKNKDNQFELKPVIVMLKMAGVPLTSVPAYVAEKDSTTKRRMMADTLNIMCDRVGKLALDHRFVHRDNIIGNVLVISNGTEIVDVNIIDWGGKYLSSIQDDVTWDDLMGWCHKRWAVYIWEAGAR